MGIEGRATAEGTRAYAERYTRLGLAPGSYSAFSEWTVSSLGIGTYLGDADSATSRGYTESLRLALRGGVNLIDTAINYREQLSERIIGQVLRELIGRKEFTRQEVVVCTKAGFLPQDAEVSLSVSEYWRHEFVQTGLLKQGDVVAGCHCISPDFLEDQLQRSLKNLGLECVDVFHLHNPEMQLSEVSREEFTRRLGLAFAWCEEKVRQGKISLYGTATWSGYRVWEDRQEYLDLAGLEALARRAGGEGHHFRVIQAPLNLMMPEALVVKNQMGRQASLLEAAQKLGLSFLASASIMQGRLSRNLPDLLSRELPGLLVDSQRALQFTRSCPGVTAALVGMKKREHVLGNLALMKADKARPETMAKIFSKADEI